MRNGHLDEFFADVSHGKFKRDSELAEEENFIQGFTVFYSWSLFTKRPTRWHDTPRQKWGQTVQRNTPGYQSQ